MLAIQNASIKQKLILLLMLISSIGLILSAVLLGIYDFFSHRRAIANDISTLARIVADNSAPAVHLGDPEYTTNALASLEARTNLLSAAIYTNADERFAEYVCRPGPKSATPLRPRPDGLYFEDHRLLTIQPINWHQKRIGTILIQFDLIELYNRPRRNALVVAVILVGTSLVIFLLSSRLQTIISGPILGLAQTAKIVSEQKNYSIRASKRTEDEIGFLIDRFNEMLAQIEKRDKALHKVNEQLVESEQKALAATQAKSQFLANMSHELRTPLNAIIGFSEVLLDPKMPVDDQTRSQFQENILQGGRHLLNLINDILDLSKIEAGKMELRPERFELAEALEGVHNLIQPLARKKQQTTALNVDQAIGEVYHDPGRFKQIMYNLLSNAVKFTPDGGKVTTTATLLPGELLEIGVSDTGIGIQPQDQAKLFEEFQQIDSGYARKQQGTGLGLALVKRVVHLMGGEISVQSEPGHGSTFTVLLPRQQGEPATTTTLVPGANGSSRLVLVVEDDEPAASLLSLHLARGGYQVERATTAEQAFEKAKHLLPAAITLDILLPKEDGWHVLKQLKEEPLTRDIPVVVISVIDDPATARNAGADAHLLKPVDVKQLLSVLDHVMKE
jgi:signal transduction histidine kinase